MSYPPVLPPAGWYPNPDNPEQQRWWDGNAWTEDVAVGAPLAPGATPDNPAPFPLGVPSAPGYQGQGYQQPGFQQPGHQQPGYQYAPYQAPPGYGQQGQQGQPGYGYGPPAHGYAGYAAPSPRGVLPDGARVAGWWWRVLARLIDSLVLILPTLLLGFRQVGDIFNVFRDYIDQVQVAVDNNQPAPDLDLFNDGTYMRAVVILAVISAVVTVVYELLMVRYLSATLGKLACGLRVRRWDSRGPLGWGTVSRRVLGYQVASVVPYLGPLYVLLDVLWPLWDQRRQAVHDKLAETAVVKRQDAQVQHPGAATGFDPMSTYPPYRG